MGNVSHYDPVFWANILAGCALIFYAYFVWMQVRGIIKPSPRMLKIVRFVCLFVLLLPVAARYQYSQATILYISSGIFALGLFIKLRRKIGL